MDLYYSPINPEGETLYALILTGAVLVEHGGFTASCVERGRCAGCRCVCQERPACGTHDGASRKTCGCHRSLTEF